MIASSVIISEFVVSCRMTDLNQAYYAPPLASYVYDLRKPDRLRVHLTVVRTGILRIYSSGFIRTSILDIKNYSLSNYTIASMKQIVK